MTRGRRASRTTSLARVESSSLPSFSVFERNDRRQDHCASLPPVKRAVARRRRLGPTTTGTSRGCTRNQTNTNKAPDIAGKAAAERVVTRAKASAMDHAALECLAGIGDMAAAESPSPPTRHKLSRHISPTMEPVPKADSSIRMESRAKTPGAIMGFVVSYGPS